MVTFSPIDLRLDSRFGLISENGGYSLVRTDLAEVILNNRELSVKSLFLYLSVYPECTEWILVDAVLGYSP